MLLFQKNATVIFRYILHIQYKTSYNGLRVIQLQEMKENTRRKMGYNFFKEQTSDKKNNSEKTKKRRNKAAVICPTLFLLCV